MIANVMERRVVEATEGHIRPSGLTRRCGQDVEGDDGGGSWGVKRPHQTILTRGKAYCHMEIEDNIWSFDLICVSDVSLKAGVAQCTASVCSSLFCSIAAMVITILIGWDLNMRNESSWIFSSDNGELKGWRAKVMQNKVWSPDWPSAVSTHCMGYGTRQVWKAQTLRQNFILKLQTLW